MQTFNEEFLDEEDNRILNEVFTELGVTTEVWFNFGLNGASVQFDGDLSLLEMRAFTEAMARMAERHASAENK